MAKNSKRLWQLNSKIAGAQGLLNVAHVGFEGGDIDVQTIEVVFDLIKPGVDGLHRRLEIVDDEALEVCPEAADFFRNLLGNFLRNELAHVGFEGGDVDVQTIEVVFDLINRMDYTEHNTKSRPIGGLGA